MFVTIRVRLFAQMAGAAGAGEVVVMVAEGACLADIRSVLAEQFPAMRWPAGTMLAVNQEYAAGERRLREDDEVAIIPPVSGG